MPYMNLMFAKSTTKELNCRQKIPPARFTLLISQSELFNSAERNSDRKSSHLGQLGCIFKIFYTFFPQDHGSLKSFSTNSQASTLYDDVQSEISKSKVSFLLFKLSFK